MLPVLIAETVGKMIADLLMHRIVELLVMLGTVGKTMTNLLLYRICRAASGAVVANDTCWNKLAIETE